MTLLSLVVCSHHTNGHTEVETRKYIYFEGMALLWDFVHVLHYISEDNNVLFTPLHLPDRCSSQ